MGLRASRGPTRRWAARRAPHAAAFCHPARFHAGAAEHRALHDEVQPVNAIAGVVERRAALQRRQVDKVRGRPQRRLGQVGE